jgi:hypothetical protein
MFTREYLQALAMATVFGRGKDYFRSGSVRQITREGDKFTARVHGSYSYKVQLTLKADGAKLKCNCQYEFEGICKHAVALGLAVLQEFGPHLAAAGPPTASPPPAATAIDSISTEVYAALSALAFDEELLDEYGADYRYDEDDELLAAANEAIAEVLVPHAEAVAEALHAGHLAQALRHWVGVCEGCAAATEPAADDYDLFDYECYPTHVRACWQALLAEQGLPQLLATKHFAAAETEAALALLAERYREPGRSAKGQPAAAPAQHPALSIPPYLYELLHALAHDSVTAAQLRLLLAEVPAPDLGLAGVLLRVAEVLADDALWLRTSELFAVQDARLTVQLLDRYRAAGDRASLRRLLGQQWAPFPQVLGPYILAHLTLADDKALYLAALEQRCRHTRRLADYRILQDHWSPEQRRTFTDEHVAQGARAGHDPLFGAELLVAESRAAELLPYLRRLNWTWHRSVPELLALTARTHPDDCLDLVLERTEALLQDPTTGRGRERYQRIAAWLTALGTQDELRPPVALFAAYLYTEYARLNALRQELRAAQLVRTHLVGKQHRLIVSEAEDEEIRALLRAKQEHPGRGSAKPC